MELGEEEEEEEEKETETEREDLVPPIATTPPPRSWKEESLSHSSSETQASVTSGISLGEAIRVKAALNLGIESWYHLPAEVDASNLTDGLETKLGLTSCRSDLTEFPTLEEGVLPSAEASRRLSPGDTAHGLLLDIQDSQSSPCLPLLVCSTQDQRFPDETLLQQSAMDFVPLRGVPDVSGAFEERSKPVHVRDAVSLTEADSSSNALCDSFTLSQHPLSFRHMEPCDASCGGGGGLSQQTSFSGQQLVSKEASEDCEDEANEEASVPQTSDHLASSTSKVMLTKANRLLQREALLAKQTCIMSVRAECLSHDSNVPATGFELSEKERNVLKHEELSSSENSSCKTALTKNSEKSEREMPKEKVKMAESESGGCRRQLETDPLRRDRSKKSDAQDVFSARTCEAGEGLLKEHGVDFNGSVKFVAVTEELQGAFLDHHQKQLSPAVRFEQEEFTPAVTSTSACAPKQLVVTDVESPCSESAPVEAEPGVSRSELTISDLSIERGHKVTGISPPFSLGGDGSFSVHFAHPNYQSTPGLLLKKSVKVEEVGAHVVKSDTQVSPSCRNEEEGSSSAAPPGSVEKQHSLQHAQKENNEHLGSSKGKYPHSGRIQSLPSLSFLEKVEAWNTSQPGEMPHVVTSCGLSPRRKAYSAAGSSSNNILSTQKSSRAPKGDVASSSRETDSLGGWHAPNKSLGLEQPLSRSQSDNAVNVASRSMALGEVLPPANSTEPVQLLEEKSNVLGVSENTSGGSMITKFRAEIVSGSGGEDEGSTGRSSDLNGFVSDEGGAQLHKEGRNSPTDGQKNCDALQNQSDNLNTPFGHVIMDKFSDISPDSLNLPASSGEGSQRGLGSAGCSSVASRHFFPSGKDNFIPPGATPLGSPKKEELNIEERIPIYLRNLGIDQSPATILSPFVPQGPIREVEFSPSELRTLKDSTDTLTRTIPQPQGKMLSAIEMTQSSLDFGTCTPTSSEGGSDILSPHELSLHFSRSCGDKAMRHSSMSCHQLETTSLLAPQQWEAEGSAVSTPAEPSQQLQPAPPDCHSDREGPMLLKSAEDLLAKKKPRSVNHSPQRWTAGSVAGAQREMEADRGSWTSGVDRKRNKGQESGSLIGSDALQEIQKLLAEVKDAAGMRCDPVLSSASPQEAGESALVLIRKEDKDEDSRLGKDSIPQFQRILSWDEAMTQRSLQREGSVITPLNPKTYSLWQENSAVSLLSSEEMMKKKPKEFRTGKSVGRSEPEGCSSVTADRNQPPFVGLAQSKGINEVSTLRTPELGNPPSSEPLGSATSVSGSFQNMLSKGSMAGSKAGGTQESYASSSGDSLAAHVKNLLGNPFSSKPLGSVSDVGRSFQSMLSQAGSGRSKAGGVQESDGSSSGDSLAARVKSLLRSEAALVPPAQTLRSTDEEERKTRAWVKLKLSSQSQDSLSDWKEENQQRIEEIKAELLLRAKKSALAKDPWVCGLEAASEYSHGQEQAMEHSKAPSDKRLQSEEQPQASRTKESSLGQNVPLYEAAPSAGYLLKDSQLTSSSAIQSPNYSQHLTAATSHSDAVVELQPLLQKDWDTSPVRSAAASDVHTQVHFPAQKQLSVETCSEEVAKQITSITFSSRKRLQSPLASMALSSSLSRDGLDEITPLEVDSAGTEEESHGKQSWERSKTCPSSSPVLAGSVSNEIAQKDRFQHVSADSTRAGAYQETDCLSDQDSVSIHADKSQPLSAKTCDVLPEDVAELGRHSARLLGLDGNTRFSQGRNRFNELSSGQQEKSSPPGHIPLYRSLEGSDPALQSDLLKGPVKSLEEEKRSPPGEAPLPQKEVAGEHIQRSHHSSPDEILSTRSVSPSSPTKKVLSCVHINLSSKCQNSELQSDVNTEKEMRSRAKPEVNTQPVSSETLPEAVSKWSAADLVPEGQRSSSFPIPVSSADPCLLLSSVTGTAGQELALQSSERPQVPLSSGGGSLKSISNSVVPAKTGRSTSDATTQITTESPEKITFSAEIYVHSADSENTAQQASLQKAWELPNNATSAHNKISPFPRQSGQPLLLPYKPLGSTGMYYVPHIKAGSKISPAGSESSAERSHSGSNDAVPPRLPADRLGLRGDTPPDSTAVTQEERISSKRAKPKLAWAEEQVIPLEASPDHLKSVKQTHPGLKPAQFYLHHPAPRCESSFPSNSELSGDSHGVGQARPSSSAVLKHWKKAHGPHHILSVGQKKGGDNEFFPLPAEADCSKEKDLNVSMSWGNEASGKELLQPGRREAEQKAARSDPLLCSQTTHLNEKGEKELPLRHKTYSSGGLDELWVRFLECQKRHQQQKFRSSGELTLVERLDRLARLLQNPIKHALTPKGSGETGEGREQKKIHVPEEGMSESIPEPSATHLEGRPRVTHEKKNFVELRKCRAGEKITCQGKKTLQHQEYLETPSATSSEARLCQEDGTTSSSSTSESDGVTQAELETATQTEGSSSISTIDTARLLRAFGHGRVRLSPRLSQLYSTISHQKSRSGKWDEGSGSTVGVEHPQATAERLRKRKESQKAASLSLDSTSASSSSWGPSPALSTRRRARMLHKGIQAGHLEIVNSATKRNTRDVGVTFPTPRCNQAKQQPRECWHCADGISGESDGLLTDHQAAGSQEKQKEQPGNFVVEKRMKRSRLHLSQGFVQAEGLKSESRKENHSNSFCGPGPSWFEPWSSTKPWRREPLREKNWQEQQHGPAPEPALPAQGAEPRPWRPHGKLTLQEALAVHRPDFISRSGERVKRLKLVMEERKMQTGLQSKQGQLFHPPEKRKGYRNASQVLSEKGFLLREKRGTIPRSEMVERSKRMYEQLPEVQKKREEERRRLEYSSYRRRAQLYQKKITNHVLGRKVPWN